MNDLERITEIEQTFGFSLNYVELEDLSKGKTFTVNNNSACRNYSTDEEGFVTGLALDFSPLFLLPDNYLANFSRLEKLKLRSTLISDFSFLKELKALRWLFLSDTDLDDCSFLLDLTSLTTLDLRNTNFSDTSSLGKMKSLTWLGLNSANLKDLSFFKELKSLTSLTLRDTNLDDYSFIKDLESLTTLDLTSNNLKDVSFLKDLNSLTELYLRSNKLSDVSFLKDLKSLTTLSLSYNELKDAAFLRELESLNALELNSNPLGDVSFLADLRSISRLHLSSNKLEDVSFLKDLKSLTGLYLSSNQLTDVSFLKDLESLTSVGLSSNKLEDFSFLKDLTSLTELYLSSVGLTDASIFKEFKSLTVLDLSVNELTDASFLEDIKSLATLYLGNNNLDDISALEELKSLTFLDLSSNKLTDIAPLKDLKSLASLNLYRNKITDLTPLKNLSSLTSLNLSKNEITDISPLENLKALTSLDLSNAIGGFLVPVRSDKPGNNVANINPLKGLKNLRVLDLRGNKNIEKKIPVEILKGWDAQKILNYYFRAKKPLNEAKIVVVGEAEFGKTLLIRRLIYNDYVDTKSTTGIKIERWENVKINNQNVQLNVWDFGGQEIMHSTHQFFFTKRTVYILVVNARRNEDRNKTEEWLKRIESFGGDSPIIVVGSKIDQNQRDDSQEGQGYFDINKRELRKDFKNIKGFYGICGNVNIGGYDDKWNDFVGALKTEIGNLKELHQPFPAEWFAVKDELEAMKDENIPHISNNTYLKNCLERNVENELDQNTIREFLNDIGVIIYFKDLFDRMIFNPEWITNGVYALTDNPSIVRNKGELEFSQLNKILTPKGYNPDEHKFILDLMRKFELCVEIEKDQRYLIPDLLLDVEEPFTGDWTNTLSFQYHYDTYLKNIFTKFVVRMYKFIHKKTWWQNGVVLEYEGSRALVKFEASNKKVKINISGANIKIRKDLLAIIRKEFKEIHREFTNFHVDEFTAHPTISLKDKDGNLKELLRKYSELANAEEDGETEIYVSELRQRVSISEWLDGIEDKMVRVRHSKIKEAGTPNVIHASSTELQNTNITGINPAATLTIEEKIDLTNEEFQQFITGTRIEELSSNITRLAEIGIGTAIILIAYFNTDEIIDKWKNGNFEPVSFIYTVFYILGAAFISFGIIRNQISLRWIDAKFESGIRWLVFKIKNEDIGEYKNLGKKIEQKQLAKYPDKLS